MSIGREILEALNRAFKLHQNADYQVSQVNIPSKFARIRFIFNVSSPTCFVFQRLREFSREKSAEMTRMYSQMSQLGQHNAELVLKNIEANTKMADLGARQQALEENLARVAGERDVQRAAVEQKAREAEAQAAELQRLRTALEEKAREAEAQSAELQRLGASLEQQKTELLHKEVAIAALIGTLWEMGEALEGKEVALQNVGAILREKEACLSTLEEATQTQKEEAQRNITGEYLRVLVDLFLFVA
jgi:chromosome segregation ATPase